MENPWGKIILGGLGGLAALSTWKSMSPEQQRKVVKFLEASFVTAGEVTLAYGQYRQQLALPPAPELAPDPTPLSPPPQWLKEALRKQVPDCQPSTGSASSVVEPPFQLEVDAQWRDVIIPPAVVLVLGKRDGGKRVIPIDAALFLAVLVAVSWARIGTRLLQKPQHHCLGDTDYGIG